MIPATALCLIALLALLFAISRDIKPLFLVAKPLASVAFILAGALATSPGPASYKTAMMVGLVLAAGGDVALMRQGKRWFLAGLVLFLAGHLAYAAACAAVLPAGAWVGWLSLAPLVGGLGALRWLWPRLGSMRGPVVAYVVGIGVMVAGALAVWQAGALPGPRAGLLAAGALLFWVSDLAVARNQFVVHSFVNRAWGLPAYYGGQLLLAWSLAG